MIKLAIVEDELFMREFLENCIDYSEFNIEICGSFCCAEDALDGLRYNKPDLVITDIVMPGMNGIEFMSEMLKINKNTHFIVISNYQDFELVRSAFRIGICDYIPKTDFELENYKETIASFVQQFHSVFETSVSNNMIVEEKLKEVFWSEKQSGLEELQEDFFGQNLRIAIIDILNYENIAEKAWSMDKGFLKFGISNCLCEVLTDFGEAQFFFNEYDKIVILFSSSDENKIIDILHTIRSFLEKYFRFYVGVYLDDIYSSLYNLKMRYTELYGLKDFRFFLPENTVVMRKSIIDFQESFDYLESYTQIENLLQKREFEPILKMLDAIKLIKPNAASVENLMFFYRNVFLLISNLMISLGIEFISTKEFKEIITFSNFEKAMNYLTSGLKLISEHLFFPDKKLVQRVDEYVQKHYAEELSLEKIANHFQYEYGYFSRMFRKLKGVTFKKYLNSIRLEKAMDLIKSSSLKYGEIAVAVGYKNYEHFSRSFREQYGCSPREIERKVTNV